MIERASVLELTEENAVGSIRLMPAVTFGRRATALTGIAPASEADGPFAAGALSWGWPWTDHITCSGGK